MDVTWFLSGGSLQATFWDLVCCFSSTKHTIVGGFYPRCRRRSKCWSISFGKKTEYWPKNRPRHLYLPWQRPWKGPPIDSLIYLKTTIAGLSTPGVYPGWSVWMFASVVITLNIPENISIHFIHPSQRLLKEPPIEELDIKKTHDSRGFLPPMLTKV